MTRSFSMGLALNPFPGRRVAAKRRPRSAFRPVLLPLEGRVVPTTYTWTGAVSGSWADDANWQGDLGPQGAPGEILVFPASAGNMANLDNDLTNYSGYILAFEGNYTLSGNALSLTYGVINSAGTSQVNVGITSPYGLTASAQTGSTLDLGGAITLQSSTFGLTLNLDTGTTAPSSNGGGTVAVSGGINGPSGVTFYGSPGTAILSGNNGYAGPTDLSGGVLQVGSGTTLGTGQLVLAGGNLQATSALSLANPIDLQAGIISGAADLTLTGSGSVDYAVTVRNTATLTFTGNLTGAGGFVYTTPGTLVLSGANSFGPTYTTFQTMLVNGQQPTTTVQMLAGTLGGVGNSGPVTVTGGTIAPGVGGLGILTIQGGLTFPRGPQLAVSLNAGASGYSELVVQGGATQLTGGAITPTLGTTVPSVGQSFTVLSSPSGLSGTFSNLAQGGIISVGGQSFQANYTSTSLVLTDVNPSMSPTVVAVHRATDPDLGDSVVLTYNKGLDPIRATRLANYRLRGAGRDGILGTRDDVTLALRGASYDNATHQVTLFLSRRRKILGSGPVQVVVNGLGRSGVADAAGHHLVGRFVGRGR